MVRLPDLKLKTVGERSIECIFVRYVEHSKAFKFYVIKPNESISINLIIKSIDVIFDENRFSLVRRPSLRIPNGTEDIGGLVNPEEVTEEDDPKTFDEVMKSQDVTFWKEAINDEMGFIMDNNTWVLADLPPGCKPLGCKWIFKRKLKVDGTIEKFKEKLVIQGFKQKSGIDYFDTYSLVARSSTIRLLIAMTSIHNLIIHQMDVNTDFLNGELEDEVYMNNLRASSCLAMKTRSDIAFDVGKLKQSMTSNLSVGSSIIKSEFVALVAASKEAERLKNLLLEISMWCQRPICTSFHPRLIVAGLH
ncbi:zinc finger, CCHC-type containing protein [Tanacetum coccineum]